VSRGNLNILTDLGGEEGEEGWRFEREVEKEVGKRRLNECKGVGL